MTKKKADPLEAILRWWDGMTEQERLARVEDALGPERPPEPPVHPERGEEFEVKR